MTTAIAYGTLARVGLGAGALWTGLLGISSLYFAFTSCQILYEEGVDRRSEKKSPLLRSEMCNYIVQHRSHALAMVILMALGSAPAAVASLYAASLLGKVVWLGAGSLALKTPFAIAILGMTVALGSFVAFCISADNLAAKTRAQASKTRAQT